MKTNSITLLLIMALTLGSCRVMQSNPNGGANTGGGNPGATPPAFALTKLALNDSFDVRYQYLAIETSKVSDPGVPQTSLDSVVYRFYVEQVYEVDSIPITVLLSSPQTIGFPSYRLTFAGQGINRVLRSYIEVYDDLELVETPSPFPGESWMALSGTSGLIVPMDYPLLAPVDNAAPRNIATAAMGDMAFVQQQEHNGKVLEARFNRMNDRPEANQQTTFRYENGAQWWQSVHYTLGSDTIMTGELLP